MLTEARIPIGYIFRKVRRELVHVVLLATGVELLVSYNRSYLPDLPLPLVAFLGTAISLLLSFKLNQSFDRWWEARKVWGAIVNDSRTLVRQLCLGQSLRGLDWHVGAVEHLSEADVRAAEKHANKPLELLQLHARDLVRMTDAGALSDYRRVAIDETLRRLSWRMLISIVRALAVIAVSVGRLANGSFPGDALGRARGDRGDLAGADHDDDLGDGEVPSPLAAEGFYLM